MQTRTRVDLGKSPAILELWLMRVLAMEHHKKYARGFFGRLAGRQA